MADAGSATSPRPAAGTDLAAPVENTLEFAATSRAANTSKQYESNWKGFVNFCEAGALVPMPATVQVVSAYLSALAKDGKSVSTVDSHLAAIKWRHDQACVSVNWSDPVLAQVVSGIHRTSTRRAVQAEAILPEDLAALVATVGTGVSGLRDRALFLVGFAGAFRRSEVTALAAENIRFVDEGMVVRLDQSKAGRGAEVRIPHGSKPDLCPVRALRAWLEASAINSGPVFRHVNKAGAVGEEALSEEGVRLILARAVRKAGLQTEGRISPHSLRAGFCTAAALKGSSLERIARHARHASKQTTLGYVRAAERLKDHAKTGPVV